jgi:predicted transcriptional regulator
METALSPLAPETEAVVLAQHGGPVSVPGSQENFVVMTMQAYRELLGIGTEEEHQASLAAIRRGLADVEAGRTRDMDEFFDELERRYQT